MCFNMFININYIRTNQHSAKKVTICSINIPIRKYLLCIYHYSIENQLHCSLYNQFEYIEKASSYTRLVHCHQSYNNFDNIHRYSYRNCLIHRTRMFRPKRIYPLYHRRGQNNIQSQCYKHRIYHRILAGMCYNLAIHRTHSCSVHSMDRYTNNIYYLVQRK